MTTGKPPKIMTAKRTTATKAEAKRGGSENGYILPKNSTNNSSEPPSNTSCVYKKINHISIKKIPLDGGTTPQQKGPQQNMKNKKTTKNN